MRRVCVHTGQTHRAEGLPQFAVWGHLLSLYVSKHRTSFPAEARPVSQKLPALTQHISP